MDSGGICFLMNLLIKILAVMQYKIIIGVIINNSSL